MREQGCIRAIYVREITMKSTFYRSGFGESDPEPGAKILQWFVGYSNKDGPRCYRLMIYDVRMMLGCVAMF